MATTWVTQSLEVVGTATAPRICGQPPSPLPVIWCECETNLQLPHFLFLLSSSWHPERYSDAGKASSEQCCPKDPARGPGHMLKLLLRGILPHWEPAGGCNNNSCTHCFLGETHRDGILDKQHSSWGSRTPATSYPWKMNGHWKAPGNQIMWAWELKMKSLPVQKAGKSQDLRTGRGRGGNSTPPATLRCNWTMWFCPMGGEHWGVMRPHSTSPALLGSWGTNDGGDTKPQGTTCCHRRAGISQLPECLENHPLPQAAVRCPGASCPPSSCGEHAQETPNTTCFHRQTML